MMESNGGDNHRAVTNAGRNRNGDDSQQEHHKRNRSRRGNRGNNTGRGGGADSNNSQTNNNSKTGEPPNKKRRNRKKKGNNNTNNQNTATDMEIDSISPTPAQVGASVNTTNEARPHVADPSFMTPFKFVDQPPESIHPQTLQAITNVMKLERLTEVQHKTLQQSRITCNENGSVVVNDVLGRARTGTGKTVAFLMPAIHTVLSSNTRKPSIQVLIISPTRELATQITTQAQQMITFHKQLSVQIIMGGTNMKTDVSRFSSKLPTVLVATPGRMKDHLENTILKNGTKFANCLSELKVLILDEADQLLEMGFRQDIFKIVSYLPPPQNRQTLLFSATMPKDLREVMARAMKPSYVTVDCIHDYGNDSNNNNTETNAHVQQTHVILPPGMDRLVVSVLEVTLQAMKQQDNYKIIAFFPTARLVGYFAELVNIGIRKTESRKFSRNCGNSFPKESSQSQSSVRQVSCCQIGNFVHFGRVGPRCRLSGSHNRHSIWFARFSRTVYSSFGTYRSCWNGW